MSLDSTIQAWTPEHLNAVRGTLDATAISCLISFEEQFPASVMIIGDNWYYIAVMKHDDGKGIAPTQGTVLTLSKASIHKVEDKITTVYVPLEEILEDFSHYFVSQEVALIPIGDRRQSEAKKLGQIISQQDDWYKVNRHGNIIKVFTLSPTLPLAL